MALLSSQNDDIEDGDIEDGDIEDGDGLESGFDDDFDEIENMLAVNIDDVADFAWFVETYLQPDKQTCPRLQKIE